MNFTDVYKVMLMIFYDVYNVLVIGELCLELLSLICLVIVTMFIGYQRY